MAGHLFHTRRGHDVDALAVGGDLNIDLFIVKLAFTQLFAEGLAGAAIFAGLIFLASGRRQQGVEYTVFSGVCGAVANFFFGVLADHLDRRFHQVADNRLDVAAHVAHFGELGGFYLDKRRTGQLRQPAGNFGFTHAGGANHQNVFRRNFRAQLVVELHTTPAVTQGNSHCALGILLADNVLIQRMDDFAGCHLGH